MRHVGPIQITGPVIQDKVSAPLATFEKPLWPSVARGARVSRQCGGIRCVVVDERMTRSVLLEADNAEQALIVLTAIRARRPELEQIAAATSRFARLIDLHAQIVGQLLFLRLEYSTGDAAGHNMTTKASDAVLSWVLEQYPHLRYGSISANYCTDKKPSAVNGILGRGKYVVAEILIPHDVCDHLLRTTAQAMAQLNVRKNLLGTALAGGVRAANAHYANMLLAFYLATGQDAANIVEGAQGFTHAEARDNGLYFSTTLPNIIVGTAGNGKEHAFVRDNLKALGCLDPAEPGHNARRLAVIAAATVLCGELSLMAAQTNPGELIKAHMKLERS